MVQIQWKIHHRINQSELLMGLAPEAGVELDVRDHLEHIVLQHDPFSSSQQPTPEKLSEYLKKFHLKGPLIVNVKSEGIEESCIKLLVQQQIKNWFFLDLSMPSFVRFSEKAARGEISGFGPDNLAVRFSDREPIEYALSFQNKATWVWVDSFNNMPLTAENYKILKKHFKICLVSPELHGHSSEKITEFKSQLAGMKIDAVCTKRADLW